MYLREVLLSAKSQKVKVLQSHFWLWWLRSTYRILWNEYVSVWLLELFILTAFTLLELCFTCQHLWSTTMTINTCSISTRWNKSFYTWRGVKPNVVYGISSAVLFQELHWLLTEVDGEQADREFRDWMARLGLWMPHLIYGCMKCRVRSFHRKNEFPRGNKKSWWLSVCPWWLQWPACTPAL